LSVFVNLSTISNNNNSNQPLQSTATMIRSMQSVPALVPAPGTGKNAGKNKKKRSNKKKRAAKAASATSSTMTSQLGAGRATVPQWCKIDIDQVANHAGGFVWKLSDLEHARRYLIMGAKDNGNYYQTTEQVSTECNTSILRVIRSKSPDDFKQLCAMIEDISVRGLAARQEPTLLTLAAAIVFAPTTEKKAAALALVPKCVRIPTHAFMLSGYVTDLSQCKPGKEKGKGWGSGFRKALGQYYTSRRGLELATAVTKYKNREGWRHEDLLRMLHVNPAALKDDGARLVVKYVFACARGEKDFICKLLTDIVAAITNERAMELLDTPIPSTKKPEKPIASSNSNSKSKFKSEPKTKTKSILTGFKSAIQTVFGGSNATTAATTPAQRKTEIRFTSPNSDEGSSVEIATSAFQWKRMFMNRVPTGGFMISLLFPPGTHDFKFIVGGVWQCDPSKPIHKTGEHENNFIVIQEQEQDQEQAQAQEQPMPACTPVSRDLVATAVYLQAIMKIEACTTSVADLYKALALVREHGLVREQIPTHLLNSLDIWTELLKSKGANGKQNGMPLEALTRNLGKFSSLPNFMGPTNTEFICTRLSSEEDIQKSRIHPFKVLVASRIYGMGKALKGALTWTVSPRVRDQLTTTFMRSFKNVTPTGKRYMAALDVSGSMDVACMGCPAISCRQASAALAHMLYETEPRVYVRGFTSSSTLGYGYGIGSTLTADNGFRNFDSLVRRGMTLDQFIQATNAPFGATDCSLPMLRAIDENLDVDVFIVMTDSETYAGKVHPQVALESYRAKANKPDAKLIVVGMTANCLTIADPNDRNTLNLAGFDASMPEIIAMFVRGEL
jgi:hypothetical protein